VVEKEKSKIKEVKQVLDNDISLLLLDANSYQKVTIKILKELVNKKNMTGIYVALNKPYKTLVKFFKANGVKTEKIFFFDTISKGLKGDKNVKFMHPEDLTGLYEEIDSRYKEIDFVLFDTVDTFLMYNKKTAIERFFTSIVGSVRNHGKKCVMFGMKEALLEQMLHVSMERISDDVLDYAPTISASEKFEKTFLKI
jgi:archaellum biogenesis ATPase FlaH